MDSLAVPLVVERGKIAALSLAFDGEANDRLL